LLLALVLLAVACKSPWPPWRARELRRQAAHAWDIDKPPADIERVAPSAALGSTPARLERAAARCRRDGRAAAAAGPS
jgi:hypothetical protein